MLDCLKNFILYIIPCVIILLIVYKFFNVEKYIFRKLLHVVAFTCVAFMLFYAKSCIIACTTSIIIALVIYPILSYLEKYPLYNDIFVQKSKGEIKRSLLMLFFMFAFVTYVTWGLLDKAYLGFTVIVMWGVGDGFAALIGIPFGKHKIKKYHKSVEGSLAMFLSSFIVGILSLHFYGQLELLRCIIYALVCSLFACIVELISPSEIDTISVPLIILILLVILNRL